MACAHKKIRDNGKTYTLLAIVPRSAGYESEWGAYNDPKFNYIHNTWEPYDIVTAAPPQSLGFNRYGTNTGYASADRKARMLYFLKMTNPMVYDLYMDGGDPDNFTPKTIDLEQLVNEKKFALSDDPDSYLPDTQAEFMEMMDKSMKDMFGNRTTYYNDYQKPFELLCG